MTSLSLRVAAAAAAATLLVACGGSDSEPEKDSETTSSAPAASGEQVSTDDFSFTAPEGWEDVTEQMAGFNAEAAWADPDAGDEFATNVNVIREPNEFDGTAEEYADANIQALEGAGYDSPSKEGSFGDWVVVTAGAEQNGTKYLVNQYYTVVDGQGWVVTFSFPDGTSDAERTELSESVMQTWQWA